MKKIFLILLFTISIYPQSELLLLMDDNAVATYPITADLEMAFDENGMTVSGWTDQSGNSRDFLQATETNQPTLTADALDGYSGLLFDGTDNFMAQADVITFEQPITIYAVIKQPTWTNNDVIFGNATCWLIQAGANTNIYQYAGGYDLFVAMTANTYHLLTIRINGASSYLQVDDGTADTDNPGIGVFSGAVINIGSGGGAAYANVELVALYFHSTSHDDAQILQVKTFLRDKYPSLP